MGCAGISLGMVSLYGLYGLVAIGLHFCIKSGFSAYFMGVSSY